MRAVNAYYTICDRTNLNDFEVILWKLSVIQNHKLGFTTVLYSNEITIQKLLQVDILRLYDEVHIVEDDRLNQINIQTFWSAIKFIAIEQEMNQPDLFMIIDTDLVLMDPSVKDRLTKPLVFWYEHEVMSCYPEEYQTPKGFVFPEWFNPCTKAVTTAIIKVDNRDLLKTWLDLCWKFMINNPDTNPDLVLTVEQRFIVGVYEHYKERPNFVLDLFEPYYPLDHFHVWGFKRTLKEVHRFNQMWLKSILILLSRVDQDEYELAIKNGGEDIAELLQNWDNTKTAPQFKYYFATK